MRRYKFALTRVFRRIYRNVRHFVWPRTIKSHPASKALRPVFESRNTKKFLGVFLIGMVIALGQFDSLVAAYQINVSEQPSEREVTPLETEEPQVKTDSGIQLPLDNFQITQNYWFLHKAIDLAAPKGSEIKPLLEGRVLAVNNGGWPWGKAVKIDHGFGCQSFYAHLSEVNVEAGQEVTKETTLGKVGTTGRATGSHLHWEVYQNGEAINPATLIGD